MLFGFDPPSSLMTINRQRELNIHNLIALEDLWGGPHRWLSVKMVLIGVIIPLLSWVPATASFLRRISFPVVPLILSPIFMTAYVFGTLDKSLFLFANDPAEIREFIYSLGMFGFALMGVINPRAVFCDQP